MQRALYRENTRAISTNASFGRVRAGLVDGVSYGVHAMLSIWLDTADRIRIHGRWVQSEARPRRLVIVSPGYTQHSGTRIMQHTAEVLAAGSDILSLDLRGTGRSEGRYTFAGAEVFDLRAAIEWASTRYDEVCVAGFSMGASIAVQTAALVGSAVHRLLLVSPPTTLFDVVRTGGPLAQGAFFLMTPRLRPQRRWAGGSLMLRYGSPFHRGSAVSAARSVTVPAMFVVGGRDALVRPRLSRWVYDAYAGPKKFEVIATGGHAEYLALTHEAAFRRAVDAWHEMRGIPEDDVR